MSPRAVLPSPPRSPSKVPTRRTLLPAGNPFSRVPPQSTRLRQLHSTLRALTARKGSREASFGRARRTRRSLAPFDTAPTPTPTPTPTPRLNFGGAPEQGARPDPAASWRASAVMRASGDHTVRAARE
ncbi:uncharacterized protein TRAVEDRAFT_50493 [Trametes versicolor FP-101664 SS1]|uniref:uncharacterized protein n=1 Tax=Trametes versicolor (strain FP-101664) TaxID=717944 RepID=UPI000462150C|nr:uncharacterized protein TRAVEDRAFT_50493 [Trametes versicolor FP-101664 SS1]EIW56002.1 hypothetical protein TRAVEDRAFT_50493 [Trametes versicolor FP-101664 SS1]